MSAAHIKRTSYHGLTRHTPALPDASDCLSLQHQTSNSKLQVPRVSFFVDNYSVPLSPVNCARSKVSSGPSSPTLLFAAQLRAHKAHTAYTLLSPWLLVW